MNEEANDFTEKQSWSTMTTHSWLTMTDKPGWLAGQNLGEKMFFQLKFSLFFENYLSHPKSVKGGIHGEFSSRFFGFLSNQWVVKVYPYPGTKIRKVLCV